VSQSDVRFTPESRHSAARSPLPAALVRRGTARLLFKRLMARHDADAASLFDPDQSVSTVNCVLIGRANDWEMMLCQKMT
jgi:hypothetical protein